ncbi:MAG: hypothetical protein sGL2_04720 [Candidatus Mesenet longicola]|nr:MAG: hypothetical protein sGL2_04720 [Candidatus Mesenet longicola]
MTWIKRKTFEKTIEIIIEEEAKKKTRGEINNACLLMALEYLSRTYFHIGQSYGISKISKHSLD